MPNLSASQQPTSQLGVCTWLDLFLNLLADGIMECLHGHFEYRTSIIRAHATTYGQRNLVNLQINSDNRPFFRTFQHPRPPLFLSIHCLSATFAPFWPYMVSSL